MTNEELISKIREEIERRIHEISHPLKDGYEIQSIGKIEGLSELLDFLSTLESEKPVPSDLDFEQELYNRFGQVKDFTLGMRIGQYFYELGCRRTAEKYDEIEYNRQREEEMMSEAAEIGTTDIYWEQDGDRAFPAFDPPVEDLLMPDIISQRFNEGDKVKIIIVKE